MNPAELETVREIIGRESPSSLLRAAQALFYDRERLAGSIDRVRDLHQTQTTDGEEWCAECGHIPLGLPCPTIRALDA